MIAPKLLYVFVMAMSATLTFLPHQAAASDFELTGPIEVFEPGICPSGKAVTLEECFDAAKEVDNGVDVNTGFNVNDWSFYIPCGCSIMSYLEVIHVYYNFLEGISACSDNDGDSTFSLVCRKEALSPTVSPTFSDPLSPTVSPTAVAGGGKF